MYHPPGGNERSNKQTVLDFKCEKILPASEKPAAPSPSTNKSGVIGNKSLEPTIACETPQKTIEPLLKKSLEDQVQLPEKVVAKSFGHLNCSLKLLGLRKKMATFKNVSTQMEILTERNFSHRHLAQMKYILPEALQIDKVLTHDKKTLSMKPDMTINLLFDVVDGHSEVSDFIALSKVFSSRLYSFFASHPEASDVPEAILPDPFNQRTDIVPDESHEDHENSQPNSTETENFPGITHSVQRFTRHFSNKVLTDFKVNVDISSQPTIPAVSNHNQDCKSNRLEELGDLVSKASDCGDTVLGTTTSQTPLAKPSSVDSSLAIETPSPSIPKRLASSCETAHKTSSSLRLTQSCMPAKRSLHFFRSKDDDESSFDLSGNELNQKGESACVDASNRLVDGVDVIYKIFKFSDFSPITKEELVHKMIMHCLDVENEDEIKEQLVLLEKHAPEWISKKLLITGEYGYEINKGSDLDSIRTRLTSL